MTRIGCRRRWAAALTLVLLAAAPSAAQNPELPDVEGSQDHPMIPRMPGYSLLEYDQKDFNFHEFELPAGPERVEGRYWNLYYEVGTGLEHPSALEIARNYQNAMGARGGETLHEEIEEWGGRVVLRTPAPGSRIWLDLTIDNHGELYRIHVVEEAVMEQTIQLTALGMALTLCEEGAVALEGIYFDTGEATIRPESHPVLEQVGRLLQASTALRYEIQGHTDDVGSPEANLDLSERRAKAVRSYLIQTFGVVSGRLSAVGYGDTRPVESNATEVERAKNRRVELVRR